MLCSECNEREAQEGRTLCFRCKIRSITFDFSHLGQLRNRMYPGLTNKETTDRIYKEAERVGDEIVPVSRGTWT